MTEQKERFMRQLDQWSHEWVIQPIVEGTREAFTGENDPNGIDFPEVKEAIRDRVFESYSAGCRATEKKLGVKKPKRTKED